MQRATKIRFGLVVAVLAALVAAHQVGVFGRLSEPRVLAASLVEAGALGYVAFVVAYTLLQPFGVPGTIFIVAAPLIWPWETAFALSMVGTMGASVVGFSFARFVARDWVSARIPARLRRYDAAIEENALRAVVMLRLILWMPQALHFFFGVSKVRFWTHFWGSVLGYIPPLLVVSYLGSRMFDASGKMQPDAWPALGGLAATSLLVAGLDRVYARRRRSSTATPSGAPREGAPSEEGPE
jgi:uncharacterized membrane protein YdjX (TVP38/TMEM64 family)